MCVLMHVSTFIASVLTRTHFAVSLWSKWIIIDIILGRISYMNWINVGSFASLNWI
jgi:hypothetical protein